MTTSQSRNLRKAGAVALSLALAMSTLAITPASAAKKVKLAKTKITVNVGKTKTVKIKNIKKKQVKKLTVKSKSTKVAKAKASKKTAIKVTGKKAGSTKVTANLKLKKKVGGKKAYKLTLKVTVKKAAAPTEAPVPTVAPTAAPTPVISGSSITLDKPAGYTCSVSGNAVTVTANITPNTSNEQVKWTIGDPTKAAVSGQSATVNGVATCEIVGLAKGETNITASIAAMSTSAKLTVEEQKIAAKIVGVKQTKANEIVVNYDIDAHKDNQGLGKSTYDVAVTRASGYSTVNYPTNHVLSSDGKSATITFNNAFADKDKVTLTLYKGKEFASSIDFVASLGEPKSCGITKTEYQKDVEEKVTFALFDANGVDVTSVYESDLDDIVKLSISKEPSVISSLQNSSSATIKMTEKGKTATLTINYFKKGNSTSTPDATNSTVITCIDPIPVVGAKHFRADKVADHKAWDNADEHTAKFYKGTDISSIAVETGKSVTVSFYASDNDGKAIDYDGYAVGTQDKEVADATIAGNDKGKFVNFVVTGGIKAASTKLNITCKKNGAETIYQIDIGTKTAKPDVDSITVTVNRKKVSNAYDTVYQGENKLTAKVLDGNGNDITDDVKNDITWTLVDEEKCLSRKIEYTNTGNNKVSLQTAGDKFSLTSTSGKEINFSAKGAMKGDYKVYASCGSKESGKQTITVENVEDKSFVSGVGSAVTYEIIADTTALEIKNNEGTSGVARLAAKIGGVFAGYVQADGRIGDAGVSQIISGNGATSTDPIGAAGFATGGVTFVTKSTANANTIIAGGANEPAVLSTMKINSKYATGISVIKMYDAGNNAVYNKFTTDNAFATAAVWYSAYDTATDVFYADENLDTGCASTKNSYKIMMKYRLAKDGKYAKTLEQSVTVKNSLYVPKITFSSRKADSMTVDNIVKLLVADVDLNKNETAEGSIVSVTGAWNSATKSVTLFDEDKKSQTIGYAQVIEDGINVYVPVGASFEVK